MLNSLGFGGVGLGIYLAFVSLRREIGALQRTSQSYAQSHDFTAAVNETLRRENERQRDEIERLSALARCARTSASADAGHVLELSDHLHRADLLDAARQSDPSEFGVMMSRMIDDPRSNWPTVLLSVTDGGAADLLIDRLLLRENSECLLLATIAAGYATTVSPASVQKIFIHTARYYHVRSQIPTYVVAQQLRYLGSSALPGLAAFLEEGQDDRLPAALAEAESMLPGGPGRIAPGMLRRLAIDTIGALRHPGSADVLVSAFETCTEKEARGTGNPTLVDEWQHNRWHACYAMHRNPSGDTVRHFRSSLASGGCDVITEVEALYHVASFDASPGRLDECLVRIEDRLPAIGRAMTDAFNWRRAHACEAVMRVATLSAHARALVSRDLRERVARLLDADSDYMVRHYAALALGQIGGEVHVEPLFRTALDDAVEPWARFASVRGLTTLLDRLHAGLSDAQVQQVNQCLNASLPTVARESRRIRLENIVLATLLTLLADHGRKESLPVLTRYTDVDVSVMGFGNLAELARTALSRCVRRVDLEIDAVSPRPRSAAPA